MEAYKAASKADIIITGRQRQWLIEWKSDKLSEWRLDVPDVQDRDKQEMAEAADGGEQEGCRGKVELSPGVELCLRGEINDA